MREISGLAKFGYFCVGLFGGLFGVLAAWFMGKDGWGWSEGGKLFGAITGAAIADALQAQHGLTIDGKKLVLDQPIKSFGSYEVKARLGYEVSGTVYVHVIEEK